MNPRMPAAAELMPEFSTADAVATPWEDVVGVLQHSEMFWISTVRRDGRPHVTPLPAMWLDGDLHFCTGPAEQKAKNLESNTGCVLTTGTNEYRRGLDVVVEGVASRVRDADRLNRLAAMWKQKLDWPFEVVEDGFKNPGAVEHFVYVFAVAPTKMLAFGKGGPYSTTRYVF